MRSRLKEEFFDLPCVELAKALLGKTLCRKSSKTNTLLSGTIVETECYLGLHDSASHSYKNRKTPRNAPMFMKAGTSYVYFTYGMYYCFNISSREEGAAVLIRALEPKSGIEQQMQNRINFKKTKSNNIKIKNLTNGPGKLCVALEIDKKSVNEQDLVKSEIIWLEDGPSYQDGDIVVSKRVGINCDQTAKDALLRFYIKDNSYVSVRDKVRESVINHQ